MKTKHLLFMTAFASAMLYGADLKPIAAFDFEGSVPGATTEGTPEYVQGVSGKAVRLSESLIKLPKFAELSPEEGSATVWIRPVNWEWNKKEFIFFLTSGDTRLNLYKYHVPLGLLFNYGNRGETTKKNTYANVPWDKFPSQSWMSLGITWSKKNHLIAIYINGTKAASAKIKDEMIPQDASQWTLNAKSFTPCDRKNATDYDNLKFFNRALTADEMLQLYRQEQPAEIKFDQKSIRRTRFNLPKLTETPNIDGNFDVREWNSAARLGGMLLENGLMDTAYPSEVYAGFRDEKLYVCYVLTLPGATKLTARQTKRDSAVYSDDAAELLLQPDNIAAEGDFYQGIFNSLGTIFDRFNGNTSWNGAWEVKSAMYEGLLNIEVAIPLKEVNGKYRDGMEWGFNFCRDRIDNRDIHFSCVSPIGSSRLTCDFGTMKFTEAGLSGSLKFDYTQLMQRKLNLNFRANNRSNQLKKVDFTVELVSPEGFSIAKEVFTKEISGNSGAEFEYTNPLHGIRSFLLKITAAEQGSSEQFYVQDIPVVFKDAFRIFDETNLGKNTVSLEIDCSSHRKTLDTAKVIGTLENQTVEFKGLPNAKGTFDLSKITPGEYTIHLKFLDKAGKELLTYQFPYNHIGQPKWLTHHAGVSNEVVWPYTPIKYHDSTLSVWGREHKFGSMLLPEIKSQNMPIFSGSPKLNVTVNGKQFTVDNFKFTVKEKADHQIKLNFTAEKAGLNFTGTMTADYDGFLWYDMDVKSDKPQKIENLEIVMPLRKETAQFFNAHYFAREKQAGKLKLPLQLKRFPSLWVGNLDIGLTFMIESFAGWRNTDQKRAYELKETQDSVEWIAHLIDRPTELKAPIHYGFAIEANPAKPNPSWARSWRLGVMRPHNIMHPWGFDRKSTKKYSGAGGFYAPVFKSMDVFKGLVKNYKEKGVDFSLYLNPFLFSNESTEYKVFHKDWENPYNVYPLCPNSSFTDLIMHLVSDLVDNGLKAVYVDSLGAVGCYNPLHGCGYTDAETGEAVMTWPIRGIRNYMRRLYTLLHGQGHNPREYFIWVHTSARNCVALNAFTDACASGEEVEDRMVTEVNYLNLYPIDEFQVYGMNSIAGVPMMLGNLGRTGPESARYKACYNDQLLLLLMMHDGLCWNDFVDEVYVSNFYKLLDKWGFKDERLKFNSYRKQKLVTSPDADIHISLYQLPERTLAVVGNWQNTPRKISVSIDKKALGLGDQISVQELRSGKKANLQELEIPGYNFVLLDIGKE